MTAVPASLFCTVLLLSSVFAEQKNITAEFGESVTLPCRARNNVNDPEAVLEWSRADLETEYVLLQRDGHFDPVKQHPSFKNRVELQNRQMKDGDVSLILKSVTTDDSGTYECRIREKQTSRLVLRSEPISIINLRVVLPEQKNITAEFGESVTLPCRARNNVNDPEAVLEWSRADLETEYVLLQRDGHFDPVKQHTSFKNRVELQNRQMKDGDVSLILKNVTTDDSGTYECRIREKQTSRLVLKSEPISIINLSVDPPPGQIGRSHDGENEEAGWAAGLKVGLPVFAGLLVVAAVVGLLIYNHKKQQRQTKKLSQ